MEQLQNYSIVRNSALFDFFVLGLYVQIDLFGMVQYYDIN